MPKQKQRPRQLDSLIPTIKTEERRLDDLLTDARARADRLVRDAETQAAARIEAAQAGLPQMLAAERQARLGAMEKQAEAAAAELQGRQAELERRARAALEEAARFIVSVVWPDTGQEQQP